jgi:hypothetical protein
MSELRERFVTCDLLVAHLDDKGKTPLSKEEYEQVMFVWEAATRQAEAEAKIKIDQIKAEQPQAQWVSVSSSKDLPEGEWLVYIPENTTSKRVQIAVVNSNLTLIGNCFDFDMKPVKAYMAAPKPPGE